MGEWVYQAWSPTRGASHRVSRDPDDMTGTVKALNMDAIARDREPDWILQSSLVEWKDETPAPRTRRPGEIDPASCSSDRLYTGLVRNSRGLALRYILRRDDSEGGKPWAALVSNYGDYTLHDDADVSDLMDIGLAPKPLGPVRGTATAVKVNEILAAELRKLTKKEDQS